MKIIYLILLSLLFISCDKSDIKLYHAEGYIVGFDPCTIRHHYDIGYVIFTSDLKDTLVTYNLPSTLYNFTDNFFNNYVNSSYFPDSIRYKFRVKISYTKATGNQIVVHECASDFNNGDFGIQILYNQVIIKSASKY